MRTELTELCWIFAPIALAPELFDAEQVVPPGVAAPQRVRVHQGEVLAC